ncbi:MAG: hypothetical protein GIW99_10205 [Candidatus Eremiobacteraeota bacterium]|nr:hypothetical protein [Candidatus Eremiobacteraeota bacterium]MBC5828033.1 hypothetical protein [Candidatus Eremiobacteraeota bacterium]
MSHTVEVCDHCEKEARILIHIKDMALVYRDDPRQRHLDAEWCVGCILRASEDDAKERK